MLVCVMNQEMFEDNMNAKEKNECRLSPEYAQPMRFSSSDGKIGRLTS